jgi:hypothetical protein
MCKVFLMGFQSRNVVGLHYVPAFITSLAIGLFEVLLVRGIIDRGATAILPICLGGSIGIVLSMKAHSYLFTAKKRGIDKPTEQ